MKLHEYYYLCCILFTSDVCNSSTTDEARDTFVQLPRFWTNVGFSPAAPLPLDSSQVADVLLSDDVQHNLEIIATLPNKAIATMRIHWLLSLVRMQCNVFHTETFYTNFSMLRRCQRNARVDYDFSMLDRFLDFLAENRLAPVIEMMGNLISGDLKDRWTDLTINILVRYAGEKLSQLAGSYSYVVLMSFYFQPDISPRTCRNGDSRPGTNPIYEHTTF